jgi:hypothetical protein
VSDKLPACRHLLRLSQRDLSEKLRQAGSLPDIFAMTNPLDCGERKVIKRGDYSRIAWHHEGCGNKMRNTDDSRFAGFSNKEVYANQKQRNH